MSKLDEIVAYKREELKESKRARPVAKLETQLKARPPVRDFRGAITQKGTLSLIAEIKRASPSAGKIREGANSVEIAKAYSQAGAQALSVLTDEKFFAGSLSDLSGVRDAVKLPVLRKDFLLDEYQVVESAAVGADCILLIVGILDPLLLRRLLKLGRDLELGALVEVHTERELGEALEADAQIIGINNRDLATLEVDLKVTEGLIRKIPAERTVVSESGIRSRADVEFIASLGAHAVLIGEELMSAPDISERIKDLMGW